MKKLGKSVLKSKPPIKIQNKREVEVFKRVIDKPGEYSPTYIKDGWDSRAFEKLERNKFIKSFNETSDVKNNRYFPHDYSEEDIEEHFRKVKIKQEAQYTEALKRSRNRQIKQLKSRKLKIYNEEIFNTWTSDDIRRIDSIVKNTSQATPNTLINGSISLLPKENNKVDIFIKMIISDDGRGYNLSLPNRGNYHDESNIRTLNADYKYDVELNERLYEAGTITYNIHLDYDPMRMKIIDAARKLT